MLDLEFNKFDLGSEEGMLLLASISILSSYVDKKEYGPHKSPDEVFLSIQELANKIFFEEEYRQAEIQKKRNKIIDDII